MTLHPRLLLAEKWSARALFAWLIAGIVLRVVGLRDEWDPAALIFYTTPWPVVAAGFGWLAARAYWRGRLDISRRHFMFVIASLLCWTVLNWHVVYEPPDMPPLRVVAWNVARPLQEFPAVATWLRQQNADILGIAEYSPKKVNIDRDWIERFPEYQFHSVGLGSGLACLVRGELTVLEEKKIFHGTFYALYRARIREEDYYILQVDIHPQENRQRPLDYLAEIASRYAGEKLIMLGDFNTPRDSAGFDACRLFMGNAFETAGSGVAETWPVFAPVLTLDQVWTSAELRPRACRHGWSLLSDHRPVIVDFGGVLRPMFRFRAPGGLPAAPATPAPATPTLRGTFPTAPAPALRPDSSQ